MNVLPNPLHAKAPLLAASVASTPAIAAQEVPSLAESFTQMLLGLGVVIALLLASLWLIKRLSAPRGQAAGLKLVGGVAVGSRERVVMLEVGEKVLVLGVTASSINTLHTLDRTEMPRTETPTGQSHAPATDFQAWFKRALDKRNQER